MNQDNDQDENMGESIPSLTDTEMLIDMMSCVQITDSICVICKENTNERIKNICLCGCDYVCHQSCSNHWISYKQGFTQCIICNSPYIPEYVRFAISQTINHRPSVLIGQLESR